MKSNLSHILPAWKACRILGEPVVKRIVTTVLRLRTRNSSSNNNNNNNNNNNSKQDDYQGGSGGYNDEDEIDYLVKALFYEGPVPSSSGTHHSAGGVSHPIPPVIAQGWKRLTSQRTLALDKASLFRYLIPSSYQPHTGSNGHMGLFDCFAYALQGHAPTSSATYYGGASASGLVWIPDILIFLAICQQYSNRVHHHYPLASSSASASAATTPAPNSSNAAGKTTNTPMTPTTAQDTIQLQQKGISTMALMAFRIYDSYQKKGAVSRDTIHRFLTDVHGEQSYKTAIVTAYLDQLFSVATNTNNNANNASSTEQQAPERQSQPTSSQPSQSNYHQNQQNHHQQPQQQPPNIDLHACLSESQFCKQILDVKQFGQHPDEEHKQQDQQDQQQSLPPMENENHIVIDQHLLLDWISQLGLAMKPYEEMPTSTAAYLETIENSYRPVCATYKLADHRLYEIKRRFHSLVESNSTVLEGDVVEDCANTGTPATSTTQQTPSPSSTSNTSSTTAPSSSSSSTVVNLPKHCITQSAFVQAVTQTNDEMGHGGYLPSHLAQWTFIGGCNHPHDKTFWGLYDVLRFGCEAVRIKGAPHQISRSNPDIPLIKFMFHIFQTGGGNRDDEYKPITTGTNTTNENNTADAHLNKDHLNRHQIGKMLCLLMDHAQFRQKADSASSSIINGEEDDDEHENEKADFDPQKPSKHQQFKQQFYLLDTEKIEDSLIHVRPAEEIGLLPLHHRTSKQDTVRLSVLIDYFLQQAGAKSQTHVTLQEFSRWHYNETDTQPANLPLSRRRLGLFMVELRLIAAVLFGIPPSCASMELTLITEIQRRHCLRYPPTDVSRRGPKGTVWYIIDHRWYQSWSSFIQKAQGTDIDAIDGRDAPFTKTPRGLGNINNRPLMSDNGSLALRSELRWRHDYEILPPLAWSALQAWYDGGPHIHRTVVPYIPSAGTASPHSRKPRIRTENEIELYPFFVTIFMCDAASRGEARPFQQFVAVSRVSPVRVILLQLCKGLDVDPDFGRLWVMGSNPQAQEDHQSHHPTNRSRLDDWLLNLDMNIVEQRNRRNLGHQEQSGSSITLLLELKDAETGIWPRGIDGKNWSFPDKSSDGELAEMGDGIVGLYNMGNTCYLNASIQCLSHTPVFRDYFTSKAYYNDINTTNPLGHQGRLAQVSAVLINSLWKRFNNSVLHHSHTKRVTTPGTHFLVSAPNLTPKTFKESLGQFNEHFSGNEQHDAQELLAFLLGGLSEDLNRIVDKPYIEAPDSDGRPDSELADIWWSNHLKREFSIIVALFTGQYKSLLTCRSCKYESARFEPFSFLQLPLPEDDHIAVAVILYPRKDGSEVLKYSVRVRNDGTLFDLLIALAKILHADEQNKQVRNSTSPATDQTEEATGATENQQIQTDQNREGSNDGAGGEQHQHCPTVKDSISDQAMDELYLRRSKNLAVVVMGEGFISKVASNTWTIQGLQNKDTGEVAPLHVYEIDPLPEENMTAANADLRTSTSDSQDDKEEIKEDNQLDSETDATDDSAEGGDKEDAKSTTAKYSFLAFVQRKSELSSRDLLHPLVHRVFGTPLLLRVVELEAYTGRQLYDLVARRLRNLVPKSVLRFLVDSSCPSEAITPTNMNINVTDSITAEHYEKDEESDYVVVEQAEQQPRSIPIPGSTAESASRPWARLRKTTTDMEEVSAGPVPRYGFRLRLTSRDGRRCALCPWFECCIGCLVPDDDRPTVALCGDSIAVDWHFAVDVATSGFGQRFNQVDQVNAQPNGGATAAIRSQRIPGVAVKNHSSMGGAGSKKKGHASAITLEDCLDAFAKEERIPEAYCSKCKDFRVQTKRMSLWRLPPIVIIHLKRFQFTQHMRRKLRDLVVFPVEGLDLSRIMAYDSVVSGGQDSTDQQLNHKESEKTTTMNGPKLQETQAATMNGRRHHDDHDDDDVHVEASDVDGTEQGGVGCSGSGGDHESSMSPSNDKGRSVMLYDLYAVVHHQGALSGGHYLASLKSDVDGRWRLFNDSTIFEIHSRDVVDGSAYILFYIRRDVKGASLSDFWDTSQREGEGLSEDDVDKLIRGRGGSDRCVIS